MATDLVGAEVQKLFHGYGWFRGVVVDTLEHRGRRYYRVEYEDGDAEDLSLAELRQICQSPVRPAPASGTGDTKAASGDPDSVDAGDSDDPEGYGPSASGQSGGEAEGIKDEAEADGWPVGLSVARRWGERHCLTPAGDVGGPSRRPGSCFGPDNRRKRGSAVKPRASTGQGRGGTTDKTKVRNRRRKRAAGKGALWPINYEKVPKRRRSDLGIVTVRVSPGFSIQKLPQMFHEFQKSWAAIGPLPAQRSARPRRFSEDCSTEGSVKHSRCKTPRAPAPEQSRFSPSESTTRTSTSPAVLNNACASPEAKGAPKPGWRDAPDDSARLASGAGTPGVSPVATGRRGGANQRPAGQRAAERRRAQRRGGGKRQSAAWSTPRCHWMASFSGADAPRIPRATTQDVMLVSPRRGEAGCAEAGVKGGGLDSCMEAAAAERPAPGRGQGQDGDGKRSGARPVAHTQRGVSEGCVAGPTPVEVPGVINLLMEANLLTLGDKVQYRDESGRVLIEGWVTWSGILCSRCAQIDDLQAFQRCAGGCGRDRPMDRIHTASGHCLRFLAARLNPSVWAAATDLEERPPAGAPGGPSREAACAPVV